jgi:hypothetical protein
MPVLVAGRQGVLKMLCWDNAKITKIKQFKNITQLFDFSILIKPQQNTILTYCSHVVFNNTLHLPGPAEHALCPSVPV